MNKLTIIFTLFYTTGLMHSQSSIRNSIAIAERDIEVTFENVVDTSGYDKKSANVFLKASKGLDQVHLIWTVHPDRNSSHFDVEYSTDSLSWYKISEVINTEGLVGTGKYSFKHTTPRTGLNLYRLKLVNEDSSFVYSNSRKVIFLGERNIVLHAVPVSNKFRPNDLVGGEAIRVLVHNLSGGLMLNLKSLPINEIDMSLLASGIYMITVTTKDGTVSIHKVTLRK